jgi:hypothetical protein
VTKLDEMLSRREDVQMMHDHENIRRAAIEGFVSQLDTALQNLQFDEALTISFRINIVGQNGRTRSWRGNQRNMPEYAAWREAVYKRDRYQCRECGGVGPLNAHHIKHWAHYPELRFDVDNGITLCLDCHEKRHPHMRFQKNGTQN